MDRSERLGTQNITKLLFNLSGPSILGMMAVTIFNLVDTIFVGRGVGTLGIAGVSVSMPFLMTVTNFGMAIGIGGASIISRSLGAKDKEKAGLVLHNLFKLVVLINIVIIVLAFIFLDPLLKIFGANDEILPYARDYSSITLIGAFFMNIINVNANAIRAEGNAKFVMFVQSFAMLINLIIDPIFIFGLQMGVKGAGLATTISQFIGATVSIWYFFKYKKRVLSLSGFSFFNKLNKKIIKETIAIGTSSFARHIAGSVMSIVLFHVLLSYSGSTAVAAFGVIFRLFMFTIMPIIGINQGFMPIVGYNYGAGNKQRVLSATRVAIIAASVMSFISFLLLFIWTRQFMSMFSTDPELIDIGTSALKIVVLAFPIIGFQIISSGMYQALGNATGAFILAISRQVMFLIPFVLILPLFMGITGIWVAFPASDILAGILSAIMLIVQVRKLKKESLVIA